MTEEISTTTDNELPLLESKKASNKEPDRSIPSELSPELTVWVSELFLGDGKVKEIIVRELGGRRRNQVGDVLLHEPFDVTKPAPTTSEFVRISNRIWRRCEEEASARRCDLSFKITAINDLRGGEFDSKSITVLPKLGTVHVSRRNTAVEGDDDVADPFGGDLLRRRSETVLQDGRFYTEFLGAFISEQFKRADAREARADAREAEKDRQIRELFSANMMLARQSIGVEDAKLERDLKREERQLLIGVKQRGANMLYGLLPNFLKSISGGEGPLAKVADSIPPGQSTESMAVEAVMQALTDDEKRQIFGEWTNDGKNITAGILREQQAVILVGILNDKAPPSELDRLIRDGSPDQLDTSQYGKIMGVLGEKASDKLMPLMALLKHRRDALDKAATQ